MEERFLKLQELLKEKESLRELFEKKTPEEAQAYLESKGIELSLDETKELGAVFAKMLNGEVTTEELTSMANGELSEDQMEKVSGGFLVATTACVVLFYTGAGAAGVGMGIAGYEIYENWDAVVDAFTSW